MKQFLNRKKKQILSFILSIATVFVLLPLNSMTAYATEYSDERWDVEKNSAGVITQIKYSFSTTDTASGTWYLYLWESGGSSMLAETSLASEDGNHVMTIDYTGNIGKTYSIGICLKDSQWSTGTSPEGWPVINNVCDCVDLSSAKNVYVNGVKQSGSLQDALLTKIEGIELNKTSLTLAKGKTYQLKATVFPGATDGDVMWSSDNEDVATVEENGLVTAVTTGDAVIVAKSAQDEDIKAECRVKVVDESKSETSKTYIVIFKIDDKIVKEISDIEKGNTIKLPSNPTKAGYTFEGWYTENGEKFTSSTKVNSDMTVHARWKKKTSSSSSSSSSHKSRKNSSDSRSLVKDSDGKISSSILAKETYANTVVGSDLIKGAGLSADKVTGLYEINTDAFKGNIAQLSDTVTNADGNKSDNKYIYVKCTKTDKDTLKVDVNSLDTDKSIYIYKTDASGNVELIKVVDAEKVKNDDKFVEVPVADGQNYIVSDTKMEEKNVASQTAQSSTDTVKEGWNKEGNSWTYIKNGQKATGWVKDTDGKWYYLKDNGTMKQGWNIDKSNNQWYYLDEATGAMKEGWLQDPQDKHWYFLEKASGIMKTGWQYIEGNWYYLNPKSTQSMWIQDNSGEWQYKKGTGKALGEMYINEKTPDGYMVGADGALIK